MHKPLPTPPFGRMCTHVCRSQVRATQLEGAVRGRDRELEKLAEMLRLTRSLEYDAYVKQSKTEEGACCVFQPRAPLGRGRASEHDCMMNG